MIEDNYCSAGDEWNRFRNRHLRVLPSPSRGSQLPRLLRCVRRTD
jgi:hypothetical protein